MKMRKTITMILIKNLTKIIIKERLCDNHKNGMLSEQFTGRLFKKVQFKVFNTIYRYEKCVKTAI